MTTSRLESQEGHIQRFQHLSDLTQWVPIVDGQLEPIFGAIDNDEPNHAVIFHSLNMFDINNQNSKGVASPPHWNDLLNCSFVDAGNELASNQQVLQGVDTQQ